LTERIDFEPEEFVHSHHIKDANELTYEFHQRQGIDPHLKALLDEKIKAQKEMYENEKRKQIIMLNNV
jgi:hypothetical protein